LCLSKNSVETVYVDCTYGWVGETGDQLELSGDCAVRKVLAWEMLLRRVAEERMFV